MLTGLNDFRFVFGKTATFFRRVSRLTMRVHISSKPAYHFLAPAKNKTSSPLMPQMIKPAVSSA